LTASINGVDGVCTGSQSLSLTSKLDLLRHMRRWWVL